MERLISQLPPLKSLIAFEAVIRLGTVTAAANELTSTQPAISHHLRQMEMHLGMQLFFRSGRHLLPTEKALEYHKQIQAALNDIAFHTEALRRQSATVKSKKLFLYCNVGLAHSWLIPRLSQLEAAFPDVDFSIISEDINNNENIAAKHHEDNEDSLILNCGPLGHKHKRIMWTEKVCVLAGKQYAKKHQLSKQTNPADLAPLDFIHMAEDKRWLNWAQWFQLNHLKIPAFSYKISFDNYHSVLLAAINNQGLALGWLGIVDVFIQNKQLIQVSASVTERDKFGYFIDTSCARHDFSFKVADYLTQLTKESIK